MDTRTFHAHITRMMGGPGSGNFGNPEQHREAGRKGGLSRSRRKNQST